VNTIAIVNNKRQARKRRVNTTLSTFNQATLMDKFADGWLTD
jgi:hypothetical protein